MNLGNKFLPPPCEPLLAAMAPVLPSIEGPTGKELRSGKLRGLKHCCDFAFGRPLGSSSVLPGLGSNNAGLSSGLLNKE